MTGFDHAQSPRLGQRTPVESTYVRIFAGTEIPEAAWPGQIIFRSDTQVLQIYSELGGWLDAVGGVAGILTFVGSSIPTSQSVGDIWFDTGHSYRMYVARAVAASTIAAGQWELAQDSAAASAAAASAASAASTAQTTANSASTAASNAQTTANAKNTTFYANSAPTALAVNDDWYDTSNSNKHYRWNGTTWVAVVAGPAAIKTTDGNAPASSPTPTVIGGVGALYVTWTAVSNADPVGYAVYVSTSSGFTPGGGTFVLSTNATSCTIKNDASGSALNYSTTYYVAIIASDADGSAAASTQASAQLYQVGNTDISASYAYLGNVTYNQLSGGTIQSDAILGGSIRTATTGARSQMTPSGFGAYDSSGNIFFNVDTSAGALSMTGSATLNNALIQGNFTMRGTTNVIDKGSTLQLVGSVSNPTTSPSYQVDWDSVQAWFDGSTPLTGMAWDGTRYITMNYLFGGNFFVYGDNGTFAGNLGVVEPSGYGGGNFGIQPLGGVVYNGTYYYVAGLAYQQSSSTWVYQIRKYSINWGTSTVTLVTYANVSALHINQAAIGRDASGNILLAFYRSDDHLIAQVYDPTALTLSSTIDCGLSPIGTHYASAYVEMQNFDYGASRLLFGDVGHNAMFAFTVSGTTGTRSTNDEFVFANNTKIVGASYGFGAQFRVMTSNGLIGKHTSINWTTASSKWWCGYDFEDTNATGGTHQTGLSGKATFTMTKRARLTITIPAIPSAGGTDDTDSAGIYLGAGSTAPADSAMYRQSVIAYPNTTAVYTSANLTSGTNPSTNNFATSAVSKVLDSGGNTLIDSSGYQQAAPTGTIRATTKATADTGWLLCDGSSKSRSTYAALFGVLGTTFGSVDGSSFNVPNMNNATFLRGNSTSAGTGGASTHSHSGTGLFADVNLSGSTMLINQNASGAFTANFQATLTRAASTTAATAGATIIGTTATASSLPPYMDVVYQIKI